MYAEFGLMLLIPGGSGSAQFMDAKTQCRHSLLFLRACLEIWRPLIAAVRFWQNFLSDWTSRCTIAVAGSGGRVEKHWRWRANYCGTSKLPARRVWGTRMLRNQFFVLQLQVQAHAYTNVQYEQVIKKWPWRLRMIPNCHTNNYWAKIIQCHSPTWRSTSNDCSRTWAVLVNGVTFSSSSFISLSPFKYKCFRIRMWLLYRSGGKETDDAEEIIFNVYPTYDSEYRQRYQGEGDHS